MIYDFHPSARQELEEALNYYDKISIELGETFLDEFERAVERILAFPEAWFLLSTNTRRCRLSRFPYNIIYQIQEEQIIIIAIAHWQRKPNYWTDRLPV
ncbi:MAG: type II toxin-antitoxin system RelE/ParE family toxin [Cyanobacteria bacterium SBLK]|nr:type II toxin-antitoxin system RelE/ParE family toxin [Cyanobacteria bacterium SBLK]